MNRQDNKGFSHIELLVVVLVTALIAGIGFTVYKRSTKDSYFSKAEAAGCPYASQYAIQRQKHYEKNKEVFLKENGAGLFWVWKLGGSTEKPDDINNNKKLKDMDLRLLALESNHPYRDEATLKEMCDIEKICKSQPTSDWGDSFKVKYCEAEQRQKRLSKNLPGMKKIYSDGKGVTVKACRDSKTNPGKPIRFAVFDTYVQAKQIVSAYEKKHNIKFKAAPRPEGFTPERWKKITVYDNGYYNSGSDRNRAISEVQKVLYNYSYSSEGNNKSTWTGQLLLNPGRSREIWSGKTNIASHQRINGMENVVDAKRMPVGTDSTIIFYNKIEKYFKKNNGNSNNPIVMFRLRYQTRKVPLSHETNWTGTHPIINPNQNDESSVRYVTRTVKTRFNNLSVCGKKMFPATYYEMAKREGWDS